MSNSTWETAETPIETAYGRSMLHCFSFGEHEEDNLLVIDCLDRSGANQAPLIRVQSACYTAEIFRSNDCDCHEQLDRSLRRIHAEGGALVYMLCDGRGAGLLTKVRGLALWHSDGIETHDAYERLGVKIDPRDYSRVGAVLLGLNLGEIRLLTNNPGKLAGLEKVGLSVLREPLIVEPSDGSRAYLATKAQKMGHLLSPLD